MLIKELTPEQQTIADMLEQAKFYGTITFKTIEDKYKAVTLNYYENGQITATVKNLYRTVPVKG